MRRTVAAVLLAASAALVTGGLTTSASAVCGGGQPGEACYCPDGSIKVGKIEIPTGFNC
jgi:hypothetical protein